MRCRRFASLLHLFATQLTPRVSSIPNRVVPGVYHFYVEVDGHLHDDGMREAIRELRSSEATNYVKEVGSFARWV